jgi:hypothetical protein
MNDYPRDELVGKVIPDDVARECLENFYDLGAPSNCYVSIYRGAANGYAHRKGYLVHRAAYTAVHGPIPDGMVVDHMCFTRRCVNVEHLRILSHFHNAQRRHGADFPFGQCRMGHDDSMRKTYTFKRGGRTLTETRCGECLRIKNQHTADIRTGLYQLELAHGLGGHEIKRNYPHKIRERQARVDAVAAARREHAA